LNWGDRDLSKLIETYGQKTGALFVASVETGARVAQVPESWVASIRSFAMNLGMAFQVLDDLLDQFATESDAGKDVGQDDAKTTFVSIMGPDKARIEACRYVKSAVRSLDEIGSPANSLVDLTRSLMEPAMGMVLHL
jgi:farnesyl diphosphate synthase